MDNVKVERLTNRIAFRFEGSIDSSNADQISEYVFSNFTPEDTIVFDCEKLTYISSAGLRMVLRAAKTAKKIAVVNTSPNVYEIFDMTGFTQMIDIRKVLREVSIEDKECIGVGYIGKIYRLDNDKIIKVFIRETALEDVYRESELAKTAFVLGVPTAIPFDVVKVKEGGYGAVFELLKSKGLNVLYAEHPENREKYIQIYIKLLKTLLSTKVDDVSNLPSKKIQSLRWVQTLRNNNAVEPAVADKLQRLIEEIPDSHILVHGDYHVKNIMMQGDEPLLIDMETIGYGHAIYEIVAFFLTYVGYPATDPNNCVSFLGFSDEEGQRIFRETINSVFADKSEEEKNAIIDKLALLGYTWLAHKTLQYEPENVVRYNHSREQILKLINKVDSLVF